MPSPIEVKGIKTAVDVLKTDEPSRRPKLYKEFLHSVLDNCGPSFVLLCAAALGKTKVTSMRATERFSLIQRMTVNKDDTEVNHPFLATLANQYQVPTFTNVQPIVELQHSNISQWPAQTATGSTAEDTSGGTLLSNFEFNSDVYVLTYENIPSLINEIAGTVSLVDPYDINTNPFITIPITWRLRDSLIPAQAGLFNTT